MEIMAAAVVNGILTGIVYGGLAVGLTLVFGVMRIINFAHGSVIMVGLFMAYWLRVLLGIDPYLAVVVVVPAMFILGYATQAVLIKPLFKRERATVVEPIGVFLLTCGLWLVLDNVALRLFGADFRTARGIATDTTFTVGSLSISTARFIASVFTLILTAGLSLFLARTDLGKAIRAVSMNRDAAALMGINVYRIYNITFGLGWATVGAMACFLLPFYYVQPSVGIVFDIKSFIVVVLGGIASLPGAIAGGLVLGLVESVGSQVVSGTYAQIMFFALFVVMLLLRPAGLLGKASR